MDTLSAAVTGPGDFTEEHVDPDYLPIPREHTATHRAGTLAADIGAEQEKDAAADLLILRLPVWWFEMLGILNGWADRVFARGFAYDAGRKYDAGLFRGKLSMVSAATGTSVGTYAPDGTDGDMLTVPWPTHNGLLRNTGFDVLPPFVAYMPGRLDPIGRQQQLDAYAQPLRTINATPRLFFHPARDYGPIERLKLGVLARSGVQRMLNLSIDASAST